MIWRDLAAFFAQGVFVKQVFGHAVLRSSHAAQVGHPVCQFFDGPHLLLQEVCLDEITQLKESNIQLELKHTILFHHHHTGKWQNCLSLFCFHLPAEIFQNKHYA